MAASTLGKGRELGKADRVESEVPSETLRPEAGAATTSFHRRSHSVVGAVGIGRGASPEIQPGVFISNGAIFRRKPNSNVLKTRTPTGA